MREDLDTFCKILSELSRSRPKSPLDIHLRFLGNNFSIMNRCVTELIRVSLLPGPDADDSIKLKSLIIPCAFLTPNSISLDEQSILRDVAEYFQSRAGFGDFCDTAMDTAHHP